MDNPEKLATYGTQDRRRRQTKQKRRTQTNTNNVHKIWALLQKTHICNISSVCISNPTLMFLHFQNKNPRLH
jgi:hypothetical protein